jgi:putative ABC transport system ATP-binding protein
MQTVQDARTAPATKRSPAVVRATDLTRRYGEGNTAVDALRGVSLEVARGQLTAIMGPSGSGKSTLMHILGCLDRPTSGNYFLDGKDVSRMSKDELAAVRNQKIGFVFQGFNLLSRTTALDNVELPLLYNAKLKLKTADRHKRAMESLEAVGLGMRFRH